MQGSSNKDCLALSQFMGPDLCTVKPLTKTNYFQWSKKVTIKLKSRKVGKGLAVSKR